MLFKNKLLFIETLVSYHTNRKFMYDICSLYTSFGYKTLIFNFVNTFTDSHIDESISVEYKPTLNIDITNSMLSQDKDYKKLIDNIFERIDNNEFDIVFINGYNILNKFDFHEILNKNLNIIVDIPNYELENLKLSTPNSYFDYCLLHLDQSVDYKDNHYTKEQLLLRIKRTEKFKKLLKK